MHDWTKDLYTFRYHWKGYGMVSWGALSCCFSSVVVWLPPRRCWKTPNRIRFRAVLASSRAGRVKPGRSRSSLIMMRPTGGRAGYGTGGVDTRGRCGDTNNGFGLLFNWNLLGSGSPHCAGLCDGVEFATVTVTVTTFGEEFLRGASKEATLPNFPKPGPISYCGGKSLNRTSLLPTVVLAAEGA